MKRDPDFFEGVEPLLIYIAKRLREALALEQVLTKAGIDYLVEPDRYRGGFIFQTERIGAFFYVMPNAVDPVRAVMREGGYKPYEELPDGN